MNKKEGFTNYIEQSNIHGLQDIALTSNNKLKFFWFAALLTAITISVFQCVNVIKNSKEEPTVTVIDVRERPVFPIVTLIPEYGHGHFINVKKLQNDNISVESAYNFLANLPSYYALDTIEEFGNLKETIFNSSYLFRGLENKTFFEKYTYKCHEVFVNCRLHYIRKDCCSLFRPIYNLRSGPTFSSMANLSQYVQGKHSGFRFEIPVIDMLNYPESKPLQQFELYLSDEVELFKWTTPFTLTFNQQYYIEIQATYYQFQHANGKCEKDRQLLLYKNYSIFQCKMEELLIFMYKTMNCTYSIWPLLNGDLPTCTLEQHLEYGSKFYQNYLIQEALIEENPCKMSCSVWEYQIRKEEISDDEKNLRVFDF